MKIIVLVKQVPDSTEIRVDKVTGTLIRAGVPSIINPDDLAGVEAALQLKEKYGATVTIISMGPPQATGMLKEEKALAGDRDCMHNYTADQAGQTADHRYPYPAALFRFPRQCSCEVKQHDPAFRQAPFGYSRVLFFFAESASHSVFCVLYIYPAAYDHVLSYR